MHASIASYRYVPLKITSVPSTESSMREFYALNCPYISSKRCNENRISLQAHHHLLILFLTVNYLQ